MKLYHKSILLFIFLLSLSACSGGGQSGFLAHYKGLSPLKGGSEPLDIILPNPEKSTVIIYSHGTDNSFKLQNCNSRYNYVHPSFLPLEKEENTYFYYLCSKITDRHAPGTYTRGRSKEILNTVNEILKAGVLPQNIFLAGQSAGGWASLLAMEHVDVLFNAAIVTAPAMAGKRSKRQGLWGNIRKQDIRRMSNFKKIDALVFAYDDDPYERPKDLSFLTDNFPDSVRMVAYTCGRGHSTGRIDCRQQQTTEIIKDYIKKQKKNFKEINGS